MRRMARRTKKSPDEPKTPRPVPRTIAELTLEAIQTLHEAMVEGSPASAVRAAAIVLREAGKPVAPAAPRSSSDIVRDAIAANAAARESHEPTAAGSANAIVPNQPTIPDEFDIIDADDGPGANG